MAEEDARPQTIQERIAALNQSHVGRAPDSAPIRPPVVPRAKTVNNPPHEVNGSAVDNKPVGNKPAPIRQNGLLPPPVPKQPPGMAAQNNGSPMINGSRPPPPPLPSRKNSSQVAPALPPRRPSGLSERRPSSESIASTTSYGTASTSGTANTTDSRNRKLAPAWGETELPPLPVRNKSESTVPQPPQRPKASGRFNLDRAQSKVKSFVKSPHLPSRTSSHDSSNGNYSTTPRLPTRPSVQSDRSEQASSHDSSNGNYSARPRLPTRPSAQSDRAEQVASEEETAKPLPLRRIPPPPSADSLSKIKQSSFATLSKHVEEEEEPAANAPPPIPMSSRPDLSALQATKPELGANNQFSSPAPAATTVCMICRDFSGPDNHAAQFPRQSLPTQDLAWLGRELTAPFPSATDKARAIFTWLHYNIKYDVDAFFNDRVQPSTPSKTLSTGLAVCEGYAGLFSTLATHAGLEALVIGGHGKGFGHSQLGPGSPLPPFSSSHAWNVVKIDGGKWKLIDPCWGAGAVQGKGQPYIQRFDPTHFTKSNDEFGLSHYPADKDQFYTDDGRPGMSWESYVLQDHNKPFGLVQPTIFTTAHEEGFSDRSFLPACETISIHQPGPLRFQFNLKCEHWTITKHSKKSAPFLFLLHTHGVDGRKDEMIPFTYVRGTGPQGGGDVWYVDITDPRILGAPGQKLAIANITSFGSQKDTRGLSAQEYKAQAGRIGMGWSYIAQWELVV